MQVLQDDSHAAPIVAVVNSAIRIHQVLPFAAASRGCILPRGEDHMPLEGYSSCTSQLKMPALLHDIVPSLTELCCLLHAISGARRLLLYTHPESKYSGHDCLRMQGEAPGTECM